MGSWLSRKQEPQGTVSIYDLSDDDLKIIFKHLPLYDRLVVSEVCHRWYDISRNPWRDIININLMMSEVSRRSRGFSRKPWRHGVSNGFTPLPIKHLPAIVKQCPNLRSIAAFCAGVLENNALRVLSRAPLLSSVKLYNANISVPAFAMEKVELFSALFSERLLNATWHELVLDDVCALTKRSYRNRLVAGSLPLSLERLQLSGLIVDRSEYRQIFPSFMDGLGRLQNLTCLTLFPLHEKCPITPVAFSLNELRKLKHLRELCIGGCHTVIAFQIRIFLTLPKLEVLFLFSVHNGSEEHLLRLVTEHPSLRILVIAGYVRTECTIPVRRVYPNGFGSNPLPLLHVFLGKMASEKIRFTKSPSAALQVYPISEPLPTFLERVEIAPIFEDVWIAAQINESAKQGAKMGRDFESAPPATSIIFVDNA